MKSADQVAQKWANNLSASTESIKAGVNAVTIAPTASAAASADKWQAKMAQQSTKDRFKSGLGRVTLQDWQQAMLNKGLSRVSTGASAAKPKFQQFMTELLPYAEGVSAKVKAMPKLTLSDSIARATTAIQEMSKFKRSA